MIEQLLHPHYYKLVEGFANKLGLYQEYLDLEYHYYTRANNLHYQAVWLYGATYAERFWPAAIKIANAWKKYKALV